MRMEDESGMYRDPYPSMQGEREIRIEQVKEQIRSWPDLPDEFKDLAIKDAEWFTETYTWRPRGGHFYGGQLGWTSWVIKNEDLNLLGNLGPAAISLVTLLSTANAPVVATAFSLALSIVLIARKINAKGVVVNPEDYHVLMTLKQTGPSPVSRIAELLGGLHIYGRDLWDDSRTLAALNRLKQVPQLDGTTTALVNESSDGRWSTSGI